MLRKFPCASFSTKIKFGGRVEHRSRDPSWCEVRPPLSPAYKMYHKIRRNSINNEVMVWASYKKLLKVGIPSYNQLLRPIAYFDYFEI